MDLIHICLLLVEGSRQTALTRSPFGPGPELSSCSPTARLPIESEIRG